MFDFVKNIFFVVIIYVLTFSVLLPVLSLFFTRIFTQSTDRCCPYTIFFFFLCLKELYELLFLKQFVFKRCTSQKLKISSKHYDVVHSLEKRYLAEQNTMELNLMFRSAYTELRLFVPASRFSK